jgi:hypothetical protein
VSPSASEERRVRWRLEMREVVVVRSWEYQADIFGEEPAPEAGGVEGLVLALGGGD